MSDSDDNPKVPVVRWQELAHELETAAGSARTAVPAVVRATSTVRRFKRALKKSRNRAKATASKRTSKTARKKKGVSKKR